MTGDGVKIYCLECGVAVADSRLINHAISMWNRVNMSAMGLAIHGVNLLIEENLTLRNVIKRGVAAANSDNPEDKQRQTNRSIVMNKRRGCQSDFTVTDEELDVFPELRFEITDFNPGRPAPVCSNPSSPAFSDPGDPAEYDVEKVILTINGKEIEITGEIKDAIIEAVDCRLDNKIENIGFMAIQEAAIDAAVYKYDDMMMHKKGA